MDNKTMIELKISAALGFFVKTVTDNSEDEVDYIANMGASAMVLIQRAMEHLDGKEKKRFAVNTIGAVLSLMEEKK